MTPTRLKAAVLAEATNLLEGDGGFRFDDLAARLNPRFRRGGSDEPRLRAALRGLKAAGMLASGGHGIITAGPWWGAPDQAGPGVALAGRLGAFMREQGGVARPREMFEALNLTDDAGRRAVHRALERSGWSVVQMDGGRWWRLHESERLALSVPGWRLSPDLALEKMTEGLPWRRLPVGLVNARRVAVGTAISRAREVAGLTEEEAAARLGGWLASDLETGRDWILAAGAESVRLSTWWGERVRRLGDDARLFAWLDLEAGRPVGSAWPGAALSSRTWGEIGRVLEAAPADLSRGRFTPGI